MGHIDAQDARTHPLLNRKPELLAYLERRGFSHASGIDISPEQVELARRRGVRAERADVFESLAGHSGTVAAIIAVDVFEHFSRDELVRLVPDEVEVVVLP